MWFVTAGMVIVLTSVYFAFYDLFSTFRFWDDEGYMLMLVRFFLDGYTIYDEIPTVYGPFYLLYKWILHAAFSVPLTNDAIRIIALGHWVLLAAICGLVVFRATGSRWGALVGYGAVFYSMLAFHNEPGHPQETIALLGALIPLVAWRSARAPGLPEWFVAGALCGLILMTKVNIGIYCLAAVGIVLLGDMQRLKATKLLYIAVVLGSMAFPFILMGTLLAEQAILHYALLASATFGSAAIVVLGWQGNGSLPWSTFASFLAGVLLVIGGSLVFMGLQDLPIDGLVRRVSGLSNSIVAKKQAAPGIFKLFSLNQILLALIAFLFALLMTSLPTGRLKWHLIGSAKTAFAIVTLAIAFTTTTEVLEIIEEPPIGWVAPWCWLCAVAAGSQRESTCRRLLAMLAAWHILLAYPVAGSQVSFGTFLVKVAAVVCAVDATRWIAACLSPNSEIVRQRVMQFSGVVLVSGVIVLMGLGGAEMKRRYDAGDPLGLPGVQWLRLEPLRAQEYRELAAAVTDAGVDVVFTTTGFNSLFFWTDARMPAPILLSHNFARMGIIDQNRIMAGLTEARNPLVVIRDPLRGELPDNDLMDWVSTQFEAYQTIGPFQVVKRKD